MASLERIVMVLLLAGVASCLLDVTGAAGASPNDEDGSGGTTTSTSGAAAGGDGGTAGQGATGGAAAGGDGGTGGQGATGGGGAGGQGGGEPPCHPPGLVDTFDGSSVDTTLWNTQGATETISVHSGSLHFTPSNQDGEWAGLVTKSSYDVTACSVWVKVPSLINDGLDGFTYFHLYNGGPQARFEVGGGLLKLSIYGGQSIQTSYDPAQHLWWKIREEGGTLYLETAPDGQSWTVGHSAPTPSLINDVTVGLGIVPGQSPSPTPGETAFDNLNALP